MLGMAFATLDSAVFLQVDANGRQGVKRLRTIVTEGYLCLRSERFAATNDLG
jgi:hypothetical protein